MKSRRARIGRIAPGLVKRPGAEPRKVYTGDSPITAEEWKTARTRFRYTQAEFGAVLDVHWNTVARRERGEMEFPHPSLARLALEQHAADLRAREPRDFTPNLPISGAEWRVYREGLGMNLTEFAEALAAHVSTVSDWDGDVATFQHPNMARLACRRLYVKAGIPFPAVKVRRVKVL